MSKTSSADRPPLLVPATVLSWNVALLECSDQAPVGWSAEHSEAAIRQAVLDQAPDIVCFQELPGVVPFIETHAMVKANPTSHSGQMAMLYHRDLAPEGVEPSAITIEGVGLLATFGPLTVATVHLAPGPGKQSVGERLAQLADIVEASPTEALVIVGDTNTRVDEIDAITDAGLIAPTPPSPTWDSRSNRFREEGHRFAAFFTRALGFGPVEILDQTVLADPVEHQGARFHLSDHFSLLVEVML